MFETTHLVALLLVILMLFAIALMILGVKRRGDGLKLLLVGTLINSGAIAVNLSIQSSGSAGLVTSGIFIAGLLCIAAGFIQLVLQLNSLLRSTAR